MWKILAPFNPKYYRPQCLFLRRNLCSTRGEIIEYGADDPKLVEAAGKDLADRLSKGQLIFREEIVEGLKNAPKVLEKLFDDPTMLLVRIAPGAA
jgi:NADPH-dependent curcumin reductase CurA